METMEKTQPVEPVIPVIAEDALPLDWTLRTIGEICEKVEKVDPTAAPNAEIQYIDIGGIDNQLLRIVDTKTYLGKDAPSRARQLVQANDVVISTVRTYLKNIALVPDELDGQVASTGFCVLRAGDPWMGKYLYYFVQSEAVLKEIGKQQRGTSYPAVRDSDIKAQFVPVPPKMDAKLIVSAIELQLGRLDAAVARLHGAKAKLKRYKQAVLKAAVEGALTEEWREKNAKVEPATKLIARLDKMRREEWDRQKKAGERRSVIQSETAEEQVQLDIDLPETWTWATPEEIASPEPYAIGIGPFGSNLKVSDYTTEGVPLIFIRHITSENFDLGLKYTSARKYKELIAHVAKPLDVLVAKMGDPPGDATIYPADRSPGVMTADIIKLRVWDTYISREYAMYCIRSYIVKEQLGLITIGVAQKKISTGRFKTLLFPMPPTEEQHVIAEMLTDRFERSKAIEESIDAQLLQSTRLRQAVLKRAFEGRLV
jgi:type I restriction enzyme S subunit